MARLLAVLARVALALVEFFQREKNRQRVDAVRTDPAGEWLRRFGGADRRTSGPTNAGSHAVAVSRLCLLTDSDSSSVD